MLRPKRPAVKFRRSGSRQPNILSACVSPHPPCNLKKAVKRFCPKTKIAHQSATATVVLWMSDPGPNTEEKIEASIQNDRHRGTHHRNATAVIQGLRRNARAAKAARVDTRLRRRRSESVGHLPRRLRTIGPRVRRRLRHHPLPD